MARAALPPCTVKDTWFALAVGTGSPASSTMVARSNATSCPFASMPSPPKSTVSLMAAGAPAYGNERRRNIKWRPCVSKHVSIKETKQHNQSSAGKSCRFSLDHGWSAAILAISNPHAPAPPPHHPSVSAAVAAFVSASAYACAYACACTASLSLPLSATL